jgi:opacity protein-like surface antigen
MVIAKLIFSTMRKLIVLLLLTIPSLALAIDLEGYYITVKGGASKTFNTGATSFDDGDTLSFQNEDLGTGTAFGFSAGKYLTDNFRLELEAIKRTGYAFDVGDTADITITNKAKIETHALFINGFYDFQPFSISNTPITPYLGGGVGFSRNKMGKNIQHDNGLADSTTGDGDTNNHFAYKLSAGTLVGLTKHLSLDVNYQYVNLGAFQSGTDKYEFGEYSNTLLKPVNGGDIKTQELMIGLQYKF